MPRAVDQHQQLALTAVDAVPLAGPLQLRRGRKGESLADPAGRDVELAGVPVLCDRDGPLAAPYGATKHAVLGLSRALRVEGTIAADGSSVSSLASAVVGKFHELVNPPM